MSQRGRRYRAAKRRGVRRSRANARTEKGRTLILIKTIRVPIGYSPSSDSSSSGPSSANFSAERRSLMAFLAAEKLATEMSTQ